VDVGQRDLVVAEFAALRAEVLCAGVEPVDFRVRGVGDQRDLADIASLRERSPCLYGVLGCLVAGVGGVQVAFAEVVRPARFELATSRSGGTTRRKRKRRRTGSGKPDSHPPDKG
jgi:hypothetical protein